MVRRKKKVPRTDPFCPACEEPLRVVGFAANHAAVVECGCGRTDIVIYCWCSPGRLVDPETGLCPKNDGWATVVKYKAERS